MARPVEEQDPMGRRAGAVVGGGEAEDVGAFDVADGDFVDGAGGGGGGWTGARRGGAGGEGEEGGEEEGLG